jgi:hypothetical protein
VMIDRSAKAADLLNIMVRSRAVACDMLHEAVLSQGQGKDTASVPIGGTFSRPGICGAALRRHNLACAHTKARYPLREAIALLAAGHDRPAHFTALLHEWSELDAAFGRLDHRRYDAEDAQATALRSSDEMAQATAARWVQQAISEHRALVAKMDTITHGVRIALEQIVKPCPEVAEA